MRHCDMTALIRHASIIWFELGFEENLISGSLEIQNLHLMAVVSHARHCARRLLIHLRGVC